MCLECRDCSGETPWSSRGKKKKKKDISTLGVLCCGFSGPFFFCFLLGYFAFYDPLRGDSSLSPAFCSAVVTALSCSASPEIPGLGSEDCPGPHLQDSIAEC